jgi:hypothetical protein
MKPRNVYSRRISQEEERQGYVLVLKNRLSFFPPPGINFSLIIDDVRRTVKVESYSCTCRGPELPHEHYFMRWRGLKAGDRAEIYQNLRKQSAYLMRILKRH